VFVTGVPGAGKTLCGLRAAFTEGSVYLTGNRPLLDVLKQALLKDASKQGDNQSNVADQALIARIQHIRDFFKSYQTTTEVPRESVIVVDEAQRMWDADKVMRKATDNRGMRQAMPQATPQATPQENAQEKAEEKAQAMPQATPQATPQDKAQEKTEENTQATPQATPQEKAQEKTEEKPQEKAKKKTKKKTKKETKKETQKETNAVYKSQPAQLLDIMARRKGGALIIALVGDGQEIFDGEGGLQEWGKAIAESRQWTAWTSKEHVNKVKGPLQRLFDPTYEKPDWLDVEHDSLYLKHSVRSAAAAKWVERVLDNKSEEAKKLGEVPVLLTRSLEKAREYLWRFSADSHQRVGLFRSSQAKRLIATIGLPNIQPNDVVKWWLWKSSDVRSSTALEAAATEFESQGLELDMCCLAWGGDLIRQGVGQGQKKGEAGEAGVRWWPRNWSGNAWTNKVTDVHHTFNVYRVLMTRSRGELIIFVPEGSKQEGSIRYDKTRDAKEFDQVYNFLKRCGAKDLPDSQVRLHSYSGH
jgi:outer membrane biosynthesis protein TonB